MGLLWPGFLFLLGLVPLIVAAYVWTLRRRRRFAVRYSSLALVREALPQQSNWRRHLPFALFVLALASLILAFSRPVANVPVPSGRATIILAIDVSRSMCSTDIAPNRLEVAKAAARSFIERQAASTQIGIVVFAGFAQLIQPPTTDQELLQDAVASLYTARRTAIGSAILESIDAISEINSNVAPSLIGLPDEVAPEPVPEGVYEPDIIVLLTDGASNAGPWPTDAARQAADRGVRVYTIGFGANGVPTSRGVPNCGDPFGGGFGGFGGGFRRQIDEVTLQQVADITDGTYYSAESAGELQDVFNSLPTYLITTFETIEISVTFTAIGALLAALAIVLAMLWNPLP